MRKSYDTKIYLGTWLMILTHKGVFMMIFDPLRDIFNAFNLLGMLLMLSIH